jgi:murein DD-endopeptidase MepM/ murein hydrolase activator NlpD
LSGSRPTRVLALATAALTALAATAVAGGGGVGTGDDDGGAGTVDKDYYFPVRAKHSYGDGYGAGRGHEGQDVFARCGKPIAAARRGRVKYRGYEGGAGNYVVINTRGSRRDHMYAHLKRRSPFRRGQRVRTGDIIGRVGDTGNARGCHLHFELWRGDWNGRPDVTRKLKLWDRWS